MKQFIDHIQKSIFSPEYYGALLTRPASFSLKYYGSLGMLLAVLMTIALSLPIIPQINKVLRGLPTSLTAYYPDDLELRVQSGVVSSSVDEPYFLPLPREFEKNFGTSGGFTHLMVIDTKTPVTLEQFSAYESLFWISSRSIAYMEDAGGKMSVSPIDPNASFVVNESNLSGWITQVEPYFHFISPVVVVAIFFFLTMRFLLILMYLLFAALVVYLLGLVLGRKWGYGTSYRISLHAVTLPLLLEQIFTLLPFSFARLPFLFTAILLVVVYVNYRKPVPSHEAPNPTNTAA